MNLASPRRNWPSGRGFERWYGFLGAETNQWYPDLVYDNHPVDPPKTPQEGYHLTDDITDKALEFIKDAKAIAPDKPFFLYYAPGACHAPHHAPKEWIDKFKGQFDMGYEALREQTLARQKKMGLVPPDTELPPINPDRHAETRTGPDGKPFPLMDVTKPWDSLSDGREAALQPHGRGLRRLPGPRRPSHRAPARLPRVDRRAREHAGAPGVRQRRQRRGRPQRLGQRVPALQRHARRPRLETLAMLDELGGPKTYNHYANGWAMAFNTPFKMWKRYEFNGGTADPCIISWPAGMKAKGEIRDQYHHAIDLVPTVLDCLGVEAPADDQGPRAERLRRREHALQLRRRQGRGRAQDAVLLACSARGGSGTTAGRPSRPTPRSAGWSHFNDDTWELYHTDDDRSELHDLAEGEPGEAAGAGQSLWFAEAGRNGAFPLDDRSPLEIILTPRPLLSPPRDRYAYFPDTAEVPEQQAVNVRNRSYSIGALVDIPAPGAQGVLFAHGSRFGGHALYVKDNRLHYVNSFVGMFEQKIDATEDLPTGKNLILSAVVRQGRRGSARSGHGHPVALLRRQEGRRGPDQDPARACSRSPARASASAATAARPVTDDYPG